RPTGRAVARVDPDLVAHGAAVADARAHADPLAEALVEVDAQRPAAEVGAEHDAILIEPVGGEHQARGARGSRDADIVTPDRRRLIDDVLPVGRRERLGMPART